MTRKIVPPHNDKDDTGAYIKQPPVSPIVPPTDPRISDISLDDLLGKQLLVLYRETRGLLVESAGGMLSKDSQQALVNYIKLTRDLKKDEKDLLENLSDEELQRITNA